MATTNEDFETIKKIVKHEIHKRKKENKLKEISKNDESNEEYTSLLKKMKKKNKKKKQKSKVSIQLTIISPKKVYTKTCDDNDRYSNEDNAGATNSNKKEFTIPIVNVTENEKELTLLNKKKNDKNKVKNDKAILKSEKYHQTLNEDTKLFSFGLNERKKKVHKPNKDTTATSTNTMISSTIEEELTFMPRKLEKKIKRKKEKSPKVQNINNLENDNAAVHTKKIQNNQTNKLLPDFIEQKKKPHKDLAINSMDTENVNEILKSLLKEKKEKKKKSKVATEEVIELSKNPIKNEFMENTISEDNSKETYNDTAMIHTSYNSSISNMAKNCELKKYKCCVCDETFTRQDNLLMHLKTHTHEKPHVCNVCNKKFLQKTNLKNHKRIHTGQKPFKCSICDQSFSLKSTLNKHGLIHTGEKPYVCDVCGQSFRQLTHLVVHNRQHTGVRPFKCGLCEKSFLSSSHLTKHLYSIHKL